jgi:undecaprenyl-diphosphatase
MTWLDAIVLAIIEGLTEFLPVSSTGHMVLASAFMGVGSDDFTKLFIIVIQLGAILAVFALYFRRFFQSTDFYIKLAIAFLPAAIMGLLFSDTIDALLESPLAVAVSLVLGGIVLLFVDRWFHHPRINSVDEIGYREAFMVGCFQCLAMIPGVSRSGATIVGGIAQRMSRTVAAEFSFFLAVPTMAGATFKKSLDYFQQHRSLSADQVNLILVGNVVAFVVAILVMKAFVGFLNRHGFRVFGWYRIAVGSAILVMLALGIELRIV